jgi:hypothetical protein
MEKAAFEDMKAKGLVQKDCKQRRATCSQLQCPKAGQYIIELGDE